jgi:hypothetical protein
VQITAVCPLHYQMEAAISDSNAVKFDNAIFAQVEISVRVQINDFLNNMDIFPIRDIHKGCLGNSERVVNLLYNPERF